MSGPLRIMSISFDRVTGTGDPLSLPVRTAKSAAVQALDWDDSSFIKSKPIAISRKSHGPLTLSVTLDLPAPLPRATKIRTSMAGSTIGNVKARDIGAPPAGPLTVQLKVDGPHFIDLTVGDFQLTWTWEFKSGGDPWTPFETTQHRIFVIADEPAEPWGRPGTPGTFVAWDDVLAFACKAAAGKKTTESCASAITEEVFRLGSMAIDGTPLSYSSGNNFVNGTGVYFLSNFFDTAKLKSGAPTAFNCVDLAGAVALLSSAIGCRQVAARLTRKSGGTFHTNPIELFGKATVDVDEFAFHEFAATRTLGGDLSNRVWDACFRIDMGSTPATAPHTLGLATNLPQQPTLTQPGYLKQLLKPGAAVSAELVFEKGVQYPDALPPGVKIIDAFLENKHIELDLILKVKPDLEKIADPAIVARVHAALTKTVAPANVRTYVVNDVSYPENILRWPVSDRKTIHMSFVTAGPDAKWIFLRRAAMLSRPPRPLKEVGDSAVLSPENDAVVMKFRDTVVYLVNDARTSDKLTDIAKEMAMTLRRAYH